MSTFTLRKPDGTQEVVTNHPATHMVASAPRPCQVVLGVVCPHGYRLDQGERTKDGDGCKVVALDAVRKHPDWKKLVEAQREELKDLQIGDEVTVLLDDGRVVLTTVRTGRPWSIGGHPHKAVWLVMLEGFTGGFSLERVRPKDWRYWAKPLAGES